MNEVLETAVNIIKSDKGKKIIKRIGIFIFGTVASAIIGNGFSNVKEYDRRNC